MNLFYVLAKKLNNEKLIEADEETLVFLMQIFYIIKLKSEKDLISVQEFKNDQNLKYSEIIKNKQIHDEILAKFKKSIDSLFYWDKLLDKIKNNQFTPDDVIFTVNELKESLCAGYTPDEANEFLQEFEQIILDTKLSPNFKNDEVLKIVIDSVDKIEISDVVDKNKTIN